MDEASNGGNFIPSFVGGRLLMGLGGDSFTVEGQVLECRATCTYMD